MIRHLASHKLHRAVIVGGCKNGNIHHVNEVILQMRQAGIDCVWIAWNLLQVELIERYFFPIPTEFASWQEVLHWRMIMPHLQKAVGRIEQINQKIAHEKQLLADYPMVCKVSRVSFRIDPKVRILLGLIRDTFDSPTNVLLLANPQRREGVLLTKSEKFPFVFKIPLVDPFSAADELRKTLFAGGMITVSVMPTEWKQVMDKNDTLGVTIEPGNWEVSPHPNLDVANVDLHHTPIWQRIVLTA